MFRSIIGKSLLVVVGIFLYSAAWSGTLSLFNNPSDVAVLIAVILAALLIGLGIWLIFKFVQWLYTL